LAFPAAYEDYPFDDITDPGKWTVMRPQSVAVSALDRTLDRNVNPVYVKGDGFLATTFCHELDHLDGIMFTDKI